MSATTRVELGRNNAGAAFIGATDFDDTGMGVRAYVLSGGDSGAVHDEVMKRRFHDLQRLMKSDVCFVISPEFLNGTNPRYAK